MKALSELKQAAPDGNPAATFLSILPHFITDKTAYEGIEIYALTIQACGSGVNVFYASTQPQIIPYIALKPCYHCEYVAGALELMINQIYAYKPELLNWH